MGTFLTSSRMNRALAARVEASVRRGTRRGATVGRRWTVALRLVVLTVLSLALLSLSTLRQREDERLERARAGLLEEVKRRRAQLAPQDLLTADRVTAVLLRAVGPYEGDLVTPELRVSGALDVALSRQTIYVRGALDQFEAEDALERAALLSQKDAFAGCLVAPPEDRTEGALLGRIREVTRSPGRTEHVHRLYDLLAGLPLLQPRWRARVETATRADEVTRLEEAFHLARMDETVAAARSRVLLYVLDEPGAAPGPTELDGERPHSVRVTLFDLDLGRPLLRLRRAVDPGAFGDRARAGHARDLDGCLLSLGVREATASLPALTAH